ALAVVEVGHQAVVADGPDPAGDLEELLAHAPDVHIDDDRGKGPVLLRMRHERLHPAGRRLDGEQALTHGSVTLCCARPQRQDAGSPSPRPKGSCLVDLDGETDYCFRKASKSSP